MFIKKVILFLSLFLLLGVFVPKSASAVDLHQVLTSENSIVVKVQEGLQYLFAFKVENKVAVLEKHAEKRLVMAQGYAEEGNKERVENVMQNYLQIKERQNILLSKIEDGDVLGIVTERIIEQQKTMEEIKTKVDENNKQNVMKIQEQVTNQVAKRVVEVNGPEGVTEFLNEVAHVWAPGTGPGGGDVGHTYAGGGKLMYAPGTGPGGGGGVVIEGGVMQFVVTDSSAGTGGGTNEVVTGGGDGGGLAPGTTAGGGYAPADPGTTETVTNTIDP